MLARHFPVKIWFQRYIVGRPNLLKISIKPVDIDSNPFFRWGANFRTIDDELYVWCYRDKYPAVIEVDASIISPKNNIQIGHVERLLPEGMYLHKTYDHRKYQGIMKIVITTNFKRTQQIQRKLLQVYIYIYIYTYSWRVQKD